jgi:uncharacterized protein
VRGVGFRDLTTDEIEHVLEKERVVRLGFATGDEMYVVPVFYTWFDGSLCGLTTPGRKTEMATESGSVAFQVDSTAATGPFEWASVTGEGTWEVVTDQAEFGPFAAKLSTSLADAPEWAAQMLQQRFMRLGMIAWRIRPAALHGRAHGPDD